MGTLEALNLDLDKLKGLGKLEQLLRGLNRRADIYIFFFMMIKEYKIIIQIFLNLSPRLSFLFGLLTNKLPGEHIPLL